jgi:hypothetical protein
MDTRKSNPRIDRPRQKFAGGSLLLIDCCVAVAVLGIFIGIIVIYGGMHAV